MLLRSTLLCCLAVTACATPQPIAAASPPPAPTRLAPSPFDARAFAAGQATPRDCEQAARELLEVDRDRAWSALSACVERSHWPRGEFTQLELLTDGAWDSELQLRPDAPRLIAKVVALRGGDVEGDLPLLHKARVPVFTLAAALKQPDVYKGRWLLLRGAIDEMKQNGSGAAAMVRETSLRATAHEVQVGTVSRNSSSATTNFTGSVVTRHGEVVRGPATVSTRGQSERATLKQKFDNERVETGRVALGRLAEADPFLEPGHDFVILARFDGVRATNTDEPPLAMVAIASYYKPNALLIQ
jgi:hypothetical protein